MKKLIAMLLCIAMIAALGAQAFALSETDAQKKEQYELKVKALEAEKKGHTDAADMIKALEQIKMDRDIAVSSLDPADADYAQDVADLYAAAVEAAGALKSANPAAAAYVNAALGVDAFAAAEVNQGYDTSKAAYDAQVKAISDMVKAVYDPEIKKNQHEADKLAEKIAEAAAIADAEAAAAKLEAAAIKAAQAAVKDPKNSAEWMKYWAAYDKVYADKELKDAKTAAETAKKSVKTAQEAAFAQAKNAVEWAQAKAYDTMEQEITKAVNDYIVGVGAALTEFYAELYA